MFDDGIIEDSHMSGAEQEEATEQHSESGNEGQPAERTGPVFTALDEIIDGDLEDDEDDQEEVLDEQDKDATPEVVDPEPDKREQTPEENAYYAEMRRQREAFERQQQMEQQLEVMRQQMPETQIAQILSQQYGVTPQEILQRLQLQQVQQEAEERGLTPQQIMWERQQAAVRQQEQQYLQAQQQYMQMNVFMSRLQQEGAEVLQKYPTITPDDLTEAVIFGQSTNSLHLPLEMLVRAKHADKLFAVDAQTARQEALAKVSGRANGAVRAPQGKPISTVETLTEEEKFFARKMGISEAEYAKWK